MVHVLREFTVTLSDRPGALAEVATAMGEAGVNMTGFLGAGRGGPSELRFTASDPARAEAWMKQGPWKWRARDAVAVPGVDEPGYVGRMATLLGQAGVNIEAAYNAFHQGGPVVLFSVDNVQAAKKALGP